MTMIRGVVKGALAVCLAAVACISVNHLYPVVPLLSSLSTYFLGILGWCTAFVSIVFLGRGYLRELFILAVSFLILGFVLGPFLEPPADPLEHLRRVHEENCGQQVSQIARENKGLWQYSMAGVVLCTDEEQVPPDSMLTKIDAVNGFFWALMAAALFVLGKRAGLTSRWAFLSVVICFLFFGTNIFSYFRYYSFAPSAGSLVICWLWTAAFFFANNRRALGLGVATALLLLPVLWVNHAQEAVFLGFIVCIWMVVNIAFSWGKKSLLPPQNAGRTSNLAGRLCTFNGAGVILFFVVCWLLPQFDFFLQWMSQFFVRDAGPGYQTFVVSWHGVYVGGRLAGLRVSETLGMISILLLVLSVPYFWSGWSDGTTEKKIRIFLLAVLPFIGYFVPLFHFIWSSNVQVIEYYRLCYISVFWIFFADFFLSFEGKVCRIFPCENSGAENSLQRLQK